MATLDEVYEVCSSIKQEIATINQRCVDRGRAIDGHQKTLYGADGAGGVVAKQNKTIDRLDRMNGTASKKDEWLYRIISPVIVGVVLGIVYALVNLWKEHNG